MVVAFILFSSAPCVWATRLVFLKKFLYDFSFQNKMHIFKYKNIQKNNETKVNLFDGIFRYVLEEAGSQGERGWHQVRGLLVEELHWWDHDRLKEGFDHGEEWWDGLVLAVSFGERRNQ